MRGIVFFDRQQVFEYGKSFSFVGLAVATFFFAISVTPSLLPRQFVVQGILSGVAGALGYAIGVGAVMLYHFLEFRDPPKIVQRFGIAITTLGFGFVMVGSLRQATFWQNSIRQRMSMPELETSYPVRIFVIALVTGIVLHLLSRFVLWCGRGISKTLHRYIPRRVSMLLSGLLIGLLAVMIGRGVVARGLLYAADRVFLYTDQLIDEGVEQPSNEWATGGPDSLVSWDSIGRWGKNFLNDGPNKDSIEAFVGDSAKQPLRVYVGMRSAEDNHARATLALEELKRVGGFQRKAIVIATPTGTGWLDPGGVDTVEYLLGGDSAIVSMQYSYLPSWMTILVDPRRSIESANALFDVVYDYWITLPAETRPKLYVYGLSLGSLGSEVSVDLLRLFEHPIDGGLFSGPPFPSRQWADLTATRNPGTPEWLPEIRDGSMVRFMNQFSKPDRAQPWGRMRYLYIEYASDPMVFFSPSMAYRKPDWIHGQRGEDVSPYLKWYPLVTFLQVGFDLPMATSVPTGYGHNYAPTDYIYGWASVLGVSDWSDDSLDRLCQYFQTTSR